MSKEGWRVRKDSLEAVVMAGEELLDLSSNSVTGVFLTVERSLALEVANEKDAPLEGVVQHAKKLSLSCQMVL